MQRRVVVGVVVFLVVVAALVVLFGDGGKASRDAEQQQAARDALMDKYDRMSMSQLALECQRICTGGRPDADLSTVERAACSNTCYTAQFNMNEAQFRDFVRSYGSNASS
jgi:hypothetical protein